MSVRLHASEHSEKFSRRTRVYLHLCVSLHAHACMYIYIYTYISATKSLSLSLGGFLHERQLHAATCNRVYSPGGVVT